MIEWLPWLPSKSCYTNLKFFETLKDTPNPSKGFRFVAFLVLEILGGSFSTPPPLVLGVGTKTLGARRVNNQLRLERKAETKFTELNDAMREYHEVFGHELPPLPREPVLSDFYILTDEQHYRELGFIALSMVGIGGVLYYFE